MKEDKHNKLTIDKKINRNQIAMITCFVVSITTLILGIIFQIVNFMYSNILSIVYFAIAGIAVVFAIYFEYRYQSLRKYRRISYGANLETENYKSLKDQPRDKEDILEENQSGSFIRNVRKVLRID